MTTAASFDDPVGYSVVRQDAGGDVVVVLSGELDLRAATELRGVLLQALEEGNGVVTLALKELSFIDSTIISVLIMGRKRAETSGGEIRLRDVPERVQRILEITGIYSLFPNETS